ncbi:unnamed protein product [Orchesella dallaii]|uniref:Uncharacterized protein n=1 Tax=Orchesella dallaii TaxID=48710 RepID=A0ABP1PHY7_9HEXA
MGDLCPCRLCCYWIPIPTTTTESNSLAKPTATTEKETNASLYMSSIDFQKVFKPFIEITKIAIEDPIIWCKKPSVFCVDCKEQLTRVWKAEKEFEEAKRRLQESQQGVWRTFQEGKNNLQSSAYREQSKIRPGRATKPNENKCGLSPTDDEDELHKNLDLPKLEEEKGGTKRKRLNTHQDQEQDKFKTEEGVHSSLNIENRSENANQLQNQQKTETLRPNCSDRDAIPGRMEVDIEDNQRVGKMDESEETPPVIDENEKPAVILAPPLDNPGSQLYCQGRWRGNLRRTLRKRRGRGGLGKNF